MIQTSLLLSCKCTLLALELDLHNKNKAVRSVSKEGHLQPPCHSKARLLSRQQHCKNNGLFRCSICNSLWIVMNAKSVRSLDSINTCTKSIILNSVFPAPSALKKIILWIAYLPTIICYMNLPLQTHATSQVKILIVNQVLTATILVDSKEHWKQNVDFCLEFLLFLANFKDCKSS